MARVGSLPEGERKSLPESWRRNNRGAWKKTNASGYRFIATNFRRFFDKKPRFYALSPKDTSSTSSKITGIGHRRKSGREAFNKSKTVPRSFLASEVSHKSEEDHRSDFNYFRDDISIHDGVFPSCSMPFRFNPRNVAWKPIRITIDLIRERERERKFVILEKMNGGKMNFFLRIGTIRWWGEFGAIWGVECASKSSSGSCRGGRKKKIYTRKVGASLNQIHNSDNRTTWRRSVVDLSRCATRKSANDFPSKPRISCFAALRLFYIPSWKPSFDNNRE